MANDDPLEQNRIAHLLRGDHLDRQQALELIHARMRNPLCGAVRQRYRSFEPSVLADLWGETIAWFVSHSGGSDFDSSRPVYGLLRVVILRRAADRLRHETAKGRALDRMREEGLYDVGKALRATKIGKRWSELDSAERAEFRQIVRGIIKPGTFQAIVWGVYVDLFPKTEDLEVLRLQVAQTIGHEVTMPSIKRALQECRRKARASLTRMGYHPREDTHGTQRTR